ncbi:MAG: alpha/beta fold hydrolase [Planctomycetaceae bacterium]|nr:alpha/beta fold hydrolase [Planctomycetaceae bacterium]
MRHYLRSRRPILALAIGCTLLVGRFTAADEPAPAVDREFTAAVDGSIQRYVEVRPAVFDPATPVDAVIALHGHGSDRWQYIQTDRGECRGVRDVAARHGMLLISPDYRAKTSWMGPQAEADVVQLIEILREKHDVRRIYLAGASMGGTAALIFAALHPELIDGVLSENGTANMVDYDQFQDAIRAAYGGSKQEVPEEYRRRSPELAAEKLTMPIAFTVGGEDALVPPDSVRRLAGQLAESGRKNVLLDDDPQRGHETGYDATVAAFEFVIRAVEGQAAP